MKSQAQGKRIRTQKRFSVVLYFLMLFYYFVPWMETGNGRLNILQFSVLLHREGMADIAADAEGIFTDLQTLNVGVRISLGIYLGMFLLESFYLVTVFLEKNWNINLLSLACSVALAYTGMIEGSLGEFAPDMLIGTLYPVGFMVLCVMEVIGRKFIELWDDTKEKIAIDEEMDKQIKEERKRRLAFEGKYTRLFFRVIWKNFRNSLKDYLALLLCNGIVFSCVLAGLLLHRMNGRGDASLDAGYLVGSGKILLQGIVELAVAGVFMLVLLLLYYLRKRIPEYGVFQTLGIRRKTLHLCMGMELGLGAGVSILTGAFCVCVGLRVHPLMYPIIFLQSIGVMIVLYLITFFVTHDLFVGMNMGSQTDLTMMKERMPGRYQGVFVLLGMVFCAMAVFRYGKIENFEGTVNLIICFAGIYLILRFGEAWYMARWEKKKGHLGKLLLYHPFFHKSRTTVWYLFGACVMQICILSVFAVQFFSAKLVSDVDALFPYDLVCLMNTEDAEDMAFADKVSKLPEVSAKRYPMFRVSGTDATEQWEGSGQPKVKGQQIGISESTYHALKKELDPGYQKKALGLDAEGETIYIVHQQDKSTKGQPIDFKTNRKRPYLYTGPACEYVDEFSYTTAFFRRDIIGEEINSLIGVFCQGERENLVVFSDDYFEKAKNIWKNTNALTGDILKGPQALPAYSEYSDEELLGLTCQGPSALLLVHADEEILEGLKPELEALQERHAKDVKYDGRLKNCYLKTAAMDTVRTELLMKQKMGRMIIAAFFGACILLILIKMLTEQKATAKKMEFFTCMGMKRKERRSLVRFEMRVYYLVISGLSAAVSIGVSAAIFRVRMYTAAEIGRMCRRMILFGAAEMILFGVMTAVLTEVYVRKADTGEKRSGK